ncbi:hypothetical protein ABL78_2316 [Leptomonas seymouri]|uniref:Uncharacterized protein n=1 Tax=Leptomonas seymouri TaxID=5684 RepID=A0A0N1PCH9_LEPSE|nr:hypothetical protein ABL78_2316 [Leptomonas seymouri]|eukprot:KPI88583.1 hypothetical protein ABL78_2316 [Leptomonas seymouri]
MDGGKRRQYVAPSIGDVSVSKTAAAAAADAAAKRLVILRRAALAQQLQPEQQQNHDVRLETSSPQATQNPPSANAMCVGTERSYAPMWRPGDPGAQALQSSSSSPSSLPSSSSPTSPPCATQQQQQQQCLPGASHLHEGLAELRAAAQLQDSHSVTQMPLIPSAAARAIAAAAAAELSMSTTSPTPMHSNIDPFDRNAQGSRGFALLRPEAFRMVGPSSSPVTSATATAAYARAHGRHLVAPADVNSRAKSPPFSLLFSASDPVDVQQPPRAALALPRPPSSRDQRQALPASAVPAEHPPTNNSAVNSALPSGSHSSERTKAHCLPSWWPPSKRGREEKAPREAEHASDSGLRARQTPKTETSAGAQKSEANEGQDDFADESGSSSSSLDSSNSTAVAHPAITSAHNNRSRQEVIAEIPFHNSEIHANAADSVKKSTGALSYRGRADPLRVVLSAQTLSEMMQRLTTAAIPASSTADKDDEESDSLEGKLNGEDQANPAALEQRGAAADAQEKLGARGEVHRLRVMLEERDRMSLEARIAKAVALPPPPANLVLDLLQQLPAAPRRAVYAQGDCPCTAKEGFSEVFHDCVQRLMTRIVLQRDGRISDTAASGSESRASSTSTPAGSLSLERLRRERRAEELRRGVQSDVRDVVAYARFVTQQHQQLHQRPSPKASASSSSTITESSTSVSQKEMREEDFNAATCSQLGPLKALVEAKLHLLQSTRTGFEANPTNHSSDAASRAEPNAREGDGNRGEDKLASPIVELSGSGGPVSGSLSTAHQCFIHVARTASSARQEKAEAAQQAEQRLAASAASWRETFKKLLQQGERRLESLRQSDGDWQDLLYPQRSNGEVLQQLQQLFMPQEVSLPTSQGDDHQQQRRWDWQKMSRKQRKLMQPHRRMFH